jgi:hypothetical protein
MVEKIIEVLKETLPELIETGVRQVNQAGLYLYLSGISPVTRNKDLVKMEIVVAGHSLIGEPKAIIAVIHDVRERIRQAENKFNGVDIFKGVHPVSFEGSLFMYAISLEIEIFNEVLNDEILL